MPPPMTTTRLIASRPDDASRVRHVALQLLHEIVDLRECDVRMQVANEMKLEPLLVKVSFEIEHERLDPQLRASERRPVPHRKSGDEVAFGGSDPAAVSTERHP